jgi:hypothetical protein
VKNGLSFYKRYGTAEVPKTLQYSTAQNGITEDGKLGYILLFFCGFLTYYNMDFLPHFVTTKIINPVALEV